MTNMAKFIEGAALLAAGLWLNAAVLPAAEAQEAEQLFKKHCASCHGPSGKGDGPAAKMLKPPPGELGVAAAKASEADLAHIIKDGGKAVGRSGSMPAYGKKLNDEQIQSLVQLVKGFSK